MQSWVSPFMVVTFESMLFIDQDVQSKIRPAEYKRYDVINEGNINKDEVKENSCS